MKTASQNIDELLREPQAASCCAVKPPAPPAAHAPSYLMTKLRLYQPVVVIAAASIVGGALVGFASAGGFSWERAMQVSMGLFLLPLALLKLFDIAGFAAAFARYDVIAKAWRPYGHVYPFLELGLALLFIAGLWPQAVHAATLVVMGMGAIGVIRAVARGKKLQCACVGSKFDLPLGGVTIAENAGMAAMAALMLLLLH